MYSLFIHHTGEPARPERAGNRHTRTHILLLLAQHRTGTLSNNIDDDVKGSCLMGYVNGRPQFSSFKDAASSRLMSIGLLLDNEISDAAVTFEQE